ncbi:MAG: hypothetical protein SVR94_16915, partial [Pseudomonadota bacterium]|nr:hypothetical protein [Pseudomonadota bacterium]
SGLRDSQNDTQMVQSEAHIYQVETTIPETPTEITPKKKIKNAGFENPARISLNLNNEKPTDYDDVGKIIKLSIFDGYSKSAVDEYCSWFPEKYRELAMAYISGSLAIPPNSEWPKWREVYKILYDSEVSPEDLKLATFTLAVNGEEFYNTREVIKYAKLVCEQRLCCTENYQKYYRVMEEYFED